MSTFRDPKESLNTGEIIHGMNNLDDPNTKDWPLRETAQTPNNCFWTESTELLKIYIKTRWTESVEQVYQRLEQKVSRWDRQKLVKYIGTMMSKLRRKTRMEHSSMHPKVLIKKPQIKKAFSVSL